MKPVSWCDRLASTPTAGVRLNAYVESADSLLAAVRPILNRYLSNTDEPQTVQVEKADLMSLVVNTDNGFRYAVDQMRASVQFNHRVRIQPSAAGVPRMEILSEAQPFTEMLKTVQSLAAELIMRMPGAKNRTIRRYFIVTTTSLARDELPPGIDQMIEYMGAPWRGELASLDLNIRSLVGSGDGYKDYCLHSVRLPESHSELLTLNLDWHREFDVEKKLTDHTLDTIASETADAALTYFEELADGSLFDAELISEH